MDLRPELGKYLLNHRRGPSQRHALVSPEDSRRPGPTTRRLRSLDERPVAKGRCAYTQRFDERASLRTTHGKENTAANNRATAMIERMSTTRRTGQRLLALVATLCLSSCGGIQNSINPAGPQAQNLSRLWWLMFIVCSIVFVLVMIALFLSLRHRTQEAADRAPTLEPSEEKERHRRNIVMGATTITIVILFVFLIASY